MQFLSDAAIITGHVPDEFVPYHIPSATVATYFNKNVKVFSQRIRVKHFAIQFHIIKCEKKCVLNPRTKYDRLTIHYMLKGRIDAFLDGGGHFPLTAGEHNMFMVKGSVDHSAIVDPGIYWCFHIDMRRETRALLCQDVPFFKRLLEVLEEKGGTINPSPVLTSTKEIALINQIMTCKLTRRAAYNFMEEKSTELLMAFGEHLADTITQILTKEDMTHQEISNLVELNATITKDLGKTGSLAELADRYNLTPLKLDQWYQSLFNKSAQEYLFLKKMMKAYELLSTLYTPFHSVATAVGYTDYESFKQDFYHYFREYPTAVRAYFE